MASTQEMKQRMQDAFNDREHAFDQIDKLLSVAETLQEKCEARERKLHLTFSFLVLWFLLWVSLPAVLFSIPELKGSPATIIVFCFCTVSAPFFLAHTGTLCFRDWRRQERDQTTIHSIVDMLREVQGAFAVHMHFSAIEEENLKIRLRRFDIGPSAVSVEKGR